MIRLNGDDCVIILPRAADAYQGHYVWSYCNVLLVLIGALLSEVTACTPDDSVQLKVARRIESLNLCFAGRKRIQHWALENPTRHEKNLMFATVRPTDRPTVRPPNRLECPSTCPPAYPCARPSPARPPARPSAHWRRRLYFPLIHSLLGLFTRLCFNELQIVIVHS